MEKKEPRWYILWFITAGMWLITFSRNLSYRGTARRMDDWILVIQFLNIIVSFAAGVVNARRYKRKHREEEEGE